MKFFKKHPQIYFSAIALLTAIVVFSFWYAKKPKGQTSPVFYGPVVEAVYGLGQVFSSETFNLHMGVPLVLSQIYVKEGDRVKKKSLLARFDQGPAIYAPFEGTITSVHFSKNELVASNATVLTLMNLEHLYLEISLEQQAMIRIQKGQRAWVSFEDLRGERIASKVSAVYPREKDFVVKVDFEQIPKGILPGMTADVAIEVGRKEKVLLAPLKAIASGKMILLRDGRAQKIDVKLGIVGQEYAEILSDNVHDGDLALLP